MSSTLKGRVGATRTAGRSATRGPSRHTARKRGPKAATRGKIKTTGTERKARAGTIAGNTLDTTWQTPPELVERVALYWNGRIPFDVATSTANPTGAKRFWTKKDDALSRAWPRSVFVNPPYGRALRSWLAKIAYSAALGCEIVSLLPCARWEQGYFHEAWCRANLVLMIRKRVAFIRPSTGDRVSGNPYASMILGFNADPRRFCRAFGVLGSIRAMSPPL